MGTDPSASGFAQLRDLLSRPLLQLLYSPLMDTLAALQHVMVDQLHDIQQCWECSVAASSMCPLDLCGSAPMDDADAMTSKVVMQVGHTYYSFGLMVILFLGTAE